MEEVVLVIFESSGHSGTETGVFCKVQIGLSTFTILNTKSAVVSSTFPELKLSEALRGRPHKLHKFKMRGWFAYSENYNYLSLCMRLWCRYNCVQMHY